MFEVLYAAVLDQNRAFTLAIADAYAHSQHPLQFRFGGFNVRIDRLWRHRFFRYRRTLQIIDLRLQFLNGPAQCNRIARQFLNTGGIEKHAGFKQHPRFAESNLPLADQVEYTLGKLEQAHVIGDRLSGAASALSNLLLRQIKFATQAGEGLSLL